MISVIIPLYNKQNTILDTINSVLNQSYTKFEVVVVNDGSTDNSLNIISSIKNNRLHIFNIKNNGVSNARNYGAKKSRFDYLLFLDADDTLEIDTLKNFSFEINSKKKVVDFLVSNYYNNKKEFRFKGSLMNKKIDVYSPFKFLFFNLVTPRIGSYVIKKELFFNLGGFNIQSKRFEDTELILKIFNNISYFSYSPFFSVNYNIDNQCLSNTANFDFDYSLKCSIKSSDSTFEKLIKYNMKYDFIKRFSNKPIKGKLVVKYPLILKFLMTTLRFLKRGFKVIFNFLN